jgi:hypothetical protein
MWQRTYDRLRRQALEGEAVEPDKLDRLSRYEVHLDRKLERMLAMLFKLKDRFASPQFPRLLNPDS